MTNKFALPTVLLIALTLPFLVALNGVRSSPAAAEANAAQATATPVCPRLTPYPSEAPPALFLGSVEAGYFQKGAPGSTFNLRGEYFPADEAITISVNSHPLATWGSAPQDFPLNRFFFVIDTSGANEGFYVISAQSQTAEAFASFTLDAASTIHHSLTSCPSGAADMLPLPPGIALVEQMFFPLIAKW